MIRTRTAAAILAATLGWAAPGLAQDEPKKDEALDRILEKIDAVKPDGARKDDAPAPKPDAAKPDPAKPGDAARPDPAKPDGEVAPKDEAIDNLLEKLGETKEEPAPKGKPAPGPKVGDEPPQPGDAPKPGDAKPDDLKAQDKPIDDRLEELTGRKKKKPQKEHDGGILAESIKEMREVEKRLSKPDTGEDTRKKEEEIVKKLDQVLEQLRTMKIVSKTQKPGPPKPGQPKPGSASQGNQPGATPGNGQPLSQMPKPPGGKKPSDATKVPWGHLQGKEAEEKANVSREIPLPAKESLIERYYLSVSKKATSQRGN